MVHTSPQWSDLVYWIYLMSFEHKTMLIRSVTITECECQESTQRSGKRGPDYLHKFHFIVYHP